MWGTNFRACSASGKMWTVLTVLFLFTFFTLILDAPRTSIPVWLAPKSNLCWAYGQRILSHTEHTRNEFHRMLSILGTEFIACWACAEMFKSRISLPIWIRFLKISCYRPLGPYGFGFCKKSQKKKFHACVPLISNEPNFGLIHLAGKCL
jgi:hypothetical protein